MRISIIMSVLTLIIIGIAPKAQSVESHGDYPVGKLSVELWFDQAKGSIYEPGDEVEIYFTASHDCYLVVYDVDTQGFVNVLFPRGDESSWIEADRIHTVPDPYDDYELTVEGPKGIEYVVAVASPYPLNIGSLYDEEDREDGYRYSGRIAGDPHESIFELNESLAWGSDAYSPEGYASDVGWFYVEREVPYPRYMVYHWYPDRYWDPYWDPYLEVGIFVDYSWDHNWCRPWWWHHGSRTIYNYWYIDSPGGVRVKWKHWQHHDPWQPEWRRVKPPRWDARYRNPRVSTDKPGQIRHKDTRDTWRNPDRHAKKIFEGDLHVREREARKRIAPARVDKKARVKNEPKRDSKKPDRKIEPRKVKKDSKPEKDDTKPVKVSEPKKKSEPKKPSKDSDDQKDQRPRKR